MAKNVIKYFCYISLICFLVLRYSPLGLIIASSIGLPMANITGISNNLIVFVLILSVFSLILYLILFKFKLIEDVTLKITFFKKYQYILLVIICFLALFIGLNKYNFYTDEFRDFSVFHIVEHYGIGAYINNFSLPISTQELDQANLEYLNWARRLHPPLQYVFATSLSSLFDGSNTIHFYRTLFALAFCIWLLIFFPLLKFNTTFLYAFATVPFGYTYLRNYTFIRCGVEFFACIGFTTFMTIIYLQYNKRLAQNSPFSKLVLFTSLLIAFWGKFTTIVAVVALLLALSISITIIGILKYARQEYTLNYERAFFSKKVLETAFIFLAVVGLYILTFRNTFMLQQQLNSYIGKISEFLPFVETPSNYIEFTGSGLPSVFNFWKSFIFWYSPILGAGLIHGIYRILSNFRFSDRSSWFDCLVILWLIIGFIGVLLVSPRAAYTGSLTFGLIYLISRGLELGNNLFARQYLAASIVFGCTEVFLTAFS